MKWWYSNVKLCACIYIHTVIQVFQSDVLVLPLDPNCTEIIFLLPLQLFLDISSSKCHNQFSSEVVPKIHPHSEFYVSLHKTLVLCGEGSAASIKTLTTRYHPFCTVCKCSLNIFTVTSYIWSSPTYRTQDHAMLWWHGTHLTMSLEVPLHINTYLLLWADTHVTH